MTDPLPPAPPPAKLTLAERFKATMDAYGPLALWIYFGSSLLVFTGFVVAIKFGFKPKSATGTAGTLAAAWVALKLTQPFRIAGTLALAPIVKRLVARMRAPRA